MAQIRTNVLRHGRSIVSESRPPQEFMRGVRGCCATYDHTCYLTSTGRTGGVLLCSRSATVPSVRLYILIIGSPSGAQAMKAKTDVNKCSHKAVDARIVWTHTIRKELRRGAPCLTTVSLLIARPRVWGIKGR
jgi:hypothetical protein